MHNRSAPIKHACSRLTGRPRKNGGAGSVFLVDDLSRLSINQATTRRQWTLRQAIERYSHHGVHGIAIWRDKLSECGLKEARRLLDEHGMRGSGLNRARPFSGGG